MRKLFLAVLVSFIFMVGVSAEGPDAVIQPENPDVIILDEDNDYEFERTYDASESEGEDLSYEWNINGETDTGEFLSYNFDRDRPETVDIKLTVIEDGGDQDFTEVTQKLRDVPEVEINDTDRTVSPDTELSFEVENLRNEYDGGLEFDWEVDGSTVAEDQSEYSREFSDTKDLTVVARDEAGLEGTDTVTVTVEEADYQVEELDVDDEIDTGETLEADVTLNNDGGAEEKELILEINEDEEDSEDIDFSGEESFTLEWNTDEDDEGDTVKVDIVIDEDILDSAEVDIVESEEDEDEEEENGEDAPDGGPEGDDDEDDENGDDSDSDEEDSGPDIQVTEVIVSPPEVDIGEEVSIDVTVENEGDETGDYTVELEVAGETIEEEVTDLSSGGSAEVQFTKEFVEAGDFDFDIGGTSASVTVNDPTADDSDEGDTNVTDTDDRGDESRDIPYLLISFLIVIIGSIIAVGAYLATHDEKRNKIADEIAQVKENFSSEEQDEEEEFEWGSYD